MVFRRGKTPRRGPIPEASESVYPIRCQYKSSPRPLCQTLAGRLHFLFHFCVPTSACASVFPLPLPLQCSQVWFRLELIMMVDRSPGQPTNSCLAQEKQDHDQPPKKRVNEIFSVSNRVVHNQLVSHTELRMSSCNIFLKLNKPITSGNLIPETPVRLHGIKITHI